MTTVTNQAILAHIAKEHTQTFTPTTLVVPDGDGLSEIPALTFTNHQNTPIILAYYPDTFFLSTNHLDPRRAPPATIHYLIHEAHPGTGRFSRFAIPLVRRMYPRL